MELGKISEKEVLELARKAYQKGNASFEVHKEKCALLVIDLQDEFVKPNWAPSWIPEATRIIPKVKNLIEHCRAENIPVIYTVFSKTNNYFDRPKSGKFMPNRYPEITIDPIEFYDGGKVYDDIAPLENEIVIHKPSYGAFYDTSLETILKNMEKDTVIICGTLTNYCCGTTARQAYERGFFVVFGSDVTATDDPEMQEPELKVLRKGFAKVLSSQEIVSLLK
jgi:nicotinamidase-related amidase